MGAYEQPKFPVDDETILATLAAVCATQGLAREVAVLAVAEARVEHTHHDNWRGGTDFYRLVVRVPAEMFARLREERDVIEKTFAENLADLTREYEADRLDVAAIVPTMVQATDWRQQALRWLRGEGINNQGRVRSDNIASRQVDGLLFRSQPEIPLYRALKQEGVTFAPLPVFLRGGADYRRIEPDFVVVRDRVVMVIEVDGDTVHRETPAEAHDRTTMLQHEGAYIERVRASECETPELAVATAQRLLQVLGRYRATRG